MMMNRLATACTYGINFLIGAIVGSLAHEAGFSILASMGWVVLVVALSTLYGAIQAGSP